MPTRSGSQEPKVHSHPAGRSTVSKFVDLEVPADRSRRGAPMRQGLISRLGTWWRGNRGELEACRRELSGSLEREAATSEVLGIISSSPADLERVFETIVANATRFCEASRATLWLAEQDGFRAAARHGALPEGFVEPGSLFRPSQGVPFARAARTRRAVHVYDLRREQAYLEGDEIIVRAVDVLGIRTLVAVPMLKADQTIGVITVHRQEVRPFADKQIALLTSFAAQAVIAIENARLLNELRERTAELSESLEQQTATSEVLGVISSSPGELEPVFQTMLANATRLCEASYGALWLCEGDAFRCVVIHGALPEPFAAFLCEPIQGRMVTLPPDGFLQGAQELCRGYGSLFILDEIQTGLSRTGKLFALEHWGLEPDFVLLGKALSGGYMPVSAMITRRDIHSRAVGTLGRCYVHQSTYGRNRLSMAAGLASLRIIERDRLVENAARMGKLLLDGLISMKAKHELVSPDCRRRYRKAA
jgi:hypothetical protein